MAMSSVISKGAVRGGGTFGKRGAVGNVGRAMGVGATCPGSKVALAAEGVGVEVGLSCVRAVVLDAAISGSISFFFGGGVVEVDKDDPSVRFLSLVGGVVSLGRASCFADELGGGWKWTVSGGVFVPSDMLAIAILHNSSDAERRRTGLRGTGRAICGAVEGPASGCAREPEVRRIDGRGDGVRTYP